MVTWDFTEELAIIKGDDFEYAFEFEDANCDPIDQESFTFTAPIIKNGTSLGNFTVAVAGHVVTLTLNQTETAALPANKKATWRLRRDDNTLISGIVEIKAL